MDEIGTSNERAVPRPRNLIGPTLEVLESLDIGNGLIASETLLTASESSHDASYKARICTMDDAEWTDDEDFLPRNVFPPWNSGNSTTRRAAARAVQHNFTNDAEPVFTDWRAGSWPESWAEYEAAPKFTPIGTPFHQVNSMIQAQQHIQMNMHTRQEATIGNDSSNSHTPPSTHSGNSPMALPPNQAASHVMPQDKGKGRARRDSGAVVAHDSGSSNASNPYDQGFQDFYSFQALDPGPSMQKPPATAAESARASGSAPAGFQWNAQSILQQEYEMRIRQEKEAAQREGRGTLKYNEETDTYHQRTQRNQASQFRDLVPQAGARNGRSRLVARDHNRPLASPTLAMRNMPWPPGIYSFDGAQQESQRLYYAQAHGEGSHVQQQHSWSQHRSMASIPTGPRRGAPAPLVNAYQHRADQTAARAAPVVSQLQVPGRGCNDDRRLCL